MVAHGLGGLYRELPVALVAVPHPHDLLGEAPGMRVLAKGCDVTAPQRGDSWLHAACCGGGMRRKGKQL